MPQIMRRRKLSETFISAPEDLSDEQDYNGLRVANPFVNSRSKLR